jgi:hypothetical protein
MNSNENMLWEVGSAIISQMAANGNKTMLINPIFQEGASLNNLTIKPDKRRNRKLYLEMPSIPVLSKGNNRFIGL